LDEEKEEEGEVGGKLLLRVIHLLIAPREENVASKSVLLQQIGFLK